jgi:hypothetical protein
MSQSLLQVMYGEFSMISGCQCGELLGLSEAVISELAFADHVGCFNSGFRQVSLVLYGTP